MLHLRDNFYKWLVEQDLSDDKCQQVQNLIDSICKEITKEELQLIHCIVEEKDIDIGYALSKYRFFANIKRKSHIIQNNEIIGITWKELVTELPLIIKGYEGRKKTALQKYNEFLSEIDLPKDILYKQNQNILTLIENKLPSDRNYLTSTEYATLCGHHERVIKRWRKERIKQGKLNQLTENPYGQGKIGPRFVMDGGRCRYYIDDLNEYYGRDIRYL